MKTRDRLKARKHSMDYRARKRVKLMDDVEGPLPRRGGRIGNVKHVCDVCGCTRKRKTKHQYHCPRCKNRKKVARIRALKDSLVSCGCSVCGYNKCTSALEFHHKDGNKEYTISKLNTVSRIVSEAKKCVVVCANCHREIHAGLISVN